MQNKTITRERTKLGKLLDEKGLTLKEFAELVYDKTGYFIAVTPLSNLCTGYRQLKKIEIAKHFATALEVDINEIL